MWPASAVPLRASFLYTAPPRPTHRSSPACVAGTSIACDSMRKRLTAASPAAATLVQLQPPCTAVMPRLHMRVRHGATAGCTAGSSPASRWTPAPTPSPAQTSRSGEGSGARLLDVRERAGWWPAALPMQPCTRLYTGLGGWGGWGVGGGSGVCQSPGQASHAAAVRAGAMRSGAHTQALPGQQRRQTPAQVACHPTPLSCELIPPFGPPPPASPAISGQLGTGRGARLPLPREGLWPVLLAVVRRERSPGRGARAAAAAPRLLRPRGPCATGRRAAGAGSRLLAPVPRRPIAPLPGAAPGACGLSVPPRLCAVDAEPAGRARLVVCAGEGTLGIFLGAAAGVLVGRRGEAGCLSVPHYLLRIRKTCRCAAEAQGRAILCGWGGIGGGVGGGLSSNGR